MKRVAESFTRNVFYIRPVHLNAAGRLFGGQLLAWMDELAGLCSWAHAKEVCVTSNIDEVEFLSAINLSDILTLEAKVTYTSRCAMEIQVEAYVECPESPRKLTNRAYFTMVAIDPETGRPKCVPQLELVDEAEQQAFERGKARARARKQRRS